MIRALCAVALLAMASLLVRAARVGIAGDYVDPVGRITTQDEALYTNSAIHMARSGGWLTPEFMGRFALYKPPVLVWVSAVSARLAGISRLALRFPVALFCSLALALVFLWTAEMRNWQAGACAAALLAGNHLWNVLGSSVMTDGLLVAFYTAAMFCLFSDPWLESKRALWGFSGSVAAAILTKSVAGILPLAVLGLYWLLAPPKYKPAFRRLLLAGALAAAIAAPWFLYQMTAHGRWFWTEHVRVEIFGFGAGAPPQTSNENRFLFYLMRMALIDPVLLAVAAVALPAYLLDLKRRSATAVLLFCWIAVMLGAVFGWQYRNVSYLLPVIPALAILGTAYGPFATMRPPAWMMLLVAGALILKVLAPTAPWGISFAERTVQPLAAPLSRYCEQARGRELLVAPIDDDLYAATLPLPRLRYGVIGSPPPPSPYGMPFASLGIILTAAQFDTLDQLKPQFLDRFREWGIDSGAPIGTLIMAGSPGEFADVVRAHPKTDFLFAEPFRQAVTAASAPTHVIVEAGAGHFFLLAREGPAQGLTPQWTCRM